MINVWLITTTATSHLRPPMARITAKSRARPNTLAYNVSEMITTPITTPINVENPKLPPMPVCVK